MKGSRDSRGNTRGGRPRKFPEPSRPVTLTLPESVLLKLKEVHPDRGRAIVKLVKTMSGNKSAAPLVEIVEMAANTGLVVIGPSTLLHQIAFLHFVEIAPERYLLALDPGHDVRSLEIAITDILDDMSEHSRTEGELVKELLRQIKRLRKSDQVSMAEILLARLDGKEK